MSKSWIPNILFDSLILSLFYILVRRLSLQLHIVASGYSDWPSFSYWSAYHIYTNCIVNQCHLIVTQCFIYQKTIQHKFIVKRIHKFIIFNVSQVYALNNTVLCIFFHKFMLYTSMCYAINISQYIHKSTYLNNAYDTFHLRLCYYAYILWCCMCLENLNYDSQLHLEYHF